LSRAATIKMIPIIVLLFMTLIHYAA